MHKVDVLLATYNGAPYLEEQFDSILNQEGVSLRILVRDDGSSDATLDIVTRYVQQFPGRVHLIEDEHRRAGVTQNFFRLLAQSSDADYFAFCDQDDVWLPGKLHAAVAGLSGCGNPCALYCCAVEYVDQSLASIGFSRTQVQPSFNNALAENITPGCTMVLSAGLRRLIVARVPEHATIHDWWAYLVASAFGSVIFDPNPYLRYRQHGGNVVGGGFSFRQKWQKRYRRFISGNAWKMAAQAEELLRLYPDMLTPAQKDLIHYFAAGKKSYFARLRFLFGRRVWRQSFYETLVIKLLVLINAY